jgi:hypothetical protein
MMDITNGFVECWQSIGRQNKAVDEMVGNSHHLKDTRKTSSVKSNQNNELNRNAKDLVKSISDMKKYLLDNRKDYINI